MRVENNIDTGLGGVRLKTLSMEWTAESPVLGKVTIRQNNLGVTPLSTLEVVQDMPPKYNNRMLVDMAVTIEKAPGGGPPWVLLNTKTGTILNNSLPGFPSQGSVYQLKEPLDLAPVGQPTQVVAQLLQYPLTVTHNP